MKASVRSKLEVLKLKGTALHTQGSQIPQAVVYRGERAAMLGMANLGEQHGGAHLCRRVAEAKEEPAGQPHYGKAKTLALGGQE